MFRFYLSLLLISFSVGALRAAEPAYKLGDIPSPGEKSRLDKKRRGEEPLDPPDKAALAAQIAEEFYQQGLTAMNEGRLEQAEGYFDRVLILIPDHSGAKSGIETVMKAYEEPSVTLSTPTINRAFLENLESDLEQAYSQDDLERAGELIEEILAVEPDHKGAKKRRVAINRKLFDQALVRAGEREKVGDLQGAIDALLVAYGYRRDAGIRTQLQDLRIRLAHENEDRSDTLYVDALAASQEGRTDEAIELCRQSLALNPKNAQAKRMMERLTPRTP